MRFPRVQGNCRYYKQNYIVVHYSKINQEMGTVSWYPQNDKYYLEETSIQVKCITYCLDTDIIKLTSNNIIFRNDTKCYFKLDGNPIKLNVVYKNQEQLVLVLFILTDKGVVYCHSDTSTMGKKIFDDGVVDMNVNSQWIATDKYTSLQFLMKNGDLYGYNMIAGESKLIAKNVVTCGYPWIIKSIQD